MTIRPQTIHDEVIDRINQIQQSTSTYASRNEFAYRQIVRECDKIIGVDAYLGYMTRGMARIIPGDERAAEDDFRNAIKLAADGSRSAEYAWCQFLVNSGRYSRALPLFKESAQPRTGLFEVRHSLGMVIGAIQWLDGALKEADDMKLHYESELDRGFIGRSSAFLSERGISDEMLAEILDLAGDVARERGLRLDTFSSSLSDFDGETTYLVKFFVSRDPEEVADMAFDLSGRLAQNASIPSDVHVTFEVR